MPLAAILLLVTLKSIPEDLYKAARVDGANMSRRFLHVTLPSLRPGLMLVLIYETMISIRHFDLFFILTQGGPAERVLDAVMADLCRDLPQPALRVRLRARLYPRARDAHPGLLLIRMLRRRL